MCVCGGGEWGGGGVAVAALERYATLLWTN